VLDKISKLNIIKTTPNNFYNYLKQFPDFKDLPDFPLCDLSHKKIYQKYYKKIEMIMKDIQRKYREDYLSIGSLSPVESTILIYLIDVFKNKKFHNFTPSTIYNIINSFEKKDNIEELIEESKNMKTTMKNLMQNILNNENIKWNIEHPILFNGNTDDLSLYNHYNIIGYNENNVYHLVFQTDYNKLNYQETMIKILLERFLIQNANNNEHDINNKIRFSGKKITTYLLILKQNRYEIFDWDFEDTIDNEIRTICKTAFIKYFKNYNKELFNYCKFIKNEKSKWEGFKSPYQFIAKDENFRKNTYINDFFNYLDQKICDGKHKEVKEMTDNFNLFEEKINEYIVDMSETYFGLNKLDDKLEW